MKNGFSQYYHLPLLAVLLSLVWMMIVVRGYYFYKYHFGRWRSWRTSSIILTVLSGILLTVYTFMYLVVYIMNQRVYNFIAVATNAAAKNGTTFNPGTLSDNDANWVAKTIQTGANTSTASRFILVTALWIVKAGLLANYVETKNVLSRRSRFILNITGPTVAITFVLVFTTMLQSTLIGNELPDVEDVRVGKYLAGISYFQMTDDVELFQSITNIITDILLVYIAVKTVQAVRYPVRAGWLLFFMGTVTIIISLFRVVFIIFSIKCGGQCMGPGTLQRIGIPIWVAAECEAFCATAVACLPGLRVVLRRANSSMQRQRHVGQRPSPPQQKHAGVSEKTSTTLVDSFA